VDEDRVMRDIPAGRILTRLGAGAFFCLALVLASGEPSGAPRQRFEKKECLDCHTQFAVRYLSLGNLHPGVKTGQCEQCHLRHGLVPKLLLKKDGNQLCLDCHTKEKIGLDRRLTHTAIKSGSCTGCHDPHASAAKHLLKAEGPGACYQCHDRKGYEKPVVHEVVRRDGCSACRRRYGYSRQDHSVFPLNAIGFAGCINPDAALGRS